jgi:predicted phosphodiesterase
MKINSPERQEFVKQLLTKYPNLGSLTLGRIAHKRRPEFFLSAENAYQSVRYFRGNHGKKLRKTGDKSLHRPNQPSGIAWSFPVSHAPDFSAFALDAARTLILSDIHIPFHDRAAVLAAVGEGKRRRLDAILLNGDVCDFFSLSRFDKNPSESSVKSELRLTRQFLGWLRQEFPKARIIYKLGNHDEWFDKYLARKAPELIGVDGVDLAHLLTAEINGLPEVPGIEWVLDQRKIVAGKLNIWHGHEIGKGSIAPPVNPARGLFMRTLDCGLMGHLHKASAHEETTSNGKLVSTWSTGCLCGLWPRYARVNKWGHGAAFLEQHSGGQFTLSPIRILRGRVL